MDCPFCGTVLLPTDMTCGHCNTPVQRGRSAAVDYGRLGPQPLGGAVPVPTSHGAMWDPKEGTDAELQRREFIARQPPRVGPPARGGRVRFRNAPQVVTADGSAEAVAARRGDYLSYCRYCDTTEPLFRVGQKRCCPSCHRFC
jgi:hypothetical protein